MNDRHFTNIRQSLRFGCLAVIALFWLAEHVDARQQYFGYFGSGYIGADAGDTCLNDPLCSGHVNTVWVHVNFSGDGVTDATAKQLEAAARSGKWVILNVQSAFNQLENGTTCENGLLWGQTFGSLSIDEQKIDRRLQSIVTTYWSLKAKPSIAALYHYDEPYWQTRERCPGVDETVLISEMTKLLDWVNRKIKRVSPGIPIAVTFSAEEVRRYGASIPKLSSFDWIGWDCYTAADHQHNFTNCSGMSQEAWGAMLLGQLAPHQRLFVVPQAHIHGLRANDHQQRLNAIGSLNLTAGWWSTLIRLNRNLIIGVFPYQWKTYGTGADEHQGVDQLPTVREQYKAIGCQILGPQCK